MGGSEDYNKNALGFYTRMWNLLEKCQGITIQVPVLPDSSQDINGLKQGKK